MKNFTKILNSKAFNDYFHINFNIFSKLKKREVLYKVHSLLDLLFYINLNHFISIFLFNETYSREKKKQKDKKIQKLIIKKKKIPLSL